MPDWARRVVENTASLTGLIETVGIQGCKLYVEGGIYGKGTTLVNNQSMRGNEINVIALQNGHPRIATSRAIPKPQRREQ